MDKKQNSTLNEKTLDESDKPDILPDNDELKSKSENENDDQSNKKNNRTFRYYL